MPCNRPPSPFSLARSSVCGFGNLAARMRPPPPVCSKTTGPDPASSCQGAKPEVVEDPGRVIRPSQQAALACESSADQIQGAVVPPDHRVSGGHQEAAIWLDGGCAPAARERELPHSRACVQADFHNAIRDSDKQLAVVSAGHAGDLGPVTPSCQRHLDRHAGRSALRHGPRQGRRGDGGKGRRRAGLPVDEQASQIRIAAAVIGGVVKDGGEQAGRIGQAGQHSLEVAAVEQQDVRPLVVRGRVESRLGVTGHGQQHASGPGCAGPDPVVKLGERVGRDGRLEPFGFQEESRLADGEDDIDLVAPSVTPGVTCASMPHHRSTEAIRVLNCCPRAWAVTCFPACRAPYPVIRSRRARVSVASMRSPCHGHYHRGRFLRHGACPRGIVRSGRRFPTGVVRSPANAVERHSGNGKLNHLTSAEAVWFAARLQRHKIRSPGSESPPAGTAVTHSSTRAVITFRYLTCDTFGAPRRKQRTDQRLRGWWWMDVCTNPGP